MARLTYLKDGEYQTKAKKCELVERLAAYEYGQPQADGDARFGKFLQELREAVRTEVRHGMKSYTSKICFIAEVLTATAGSPVELSFTSGQIKKCFDVAKEKST